MEPCKEVRELRNKYYEEFLAYVERKILNNVLDGYIFIDEYAVNGHFFDCFGHTRGLPTNPVTEDIRVVSVLFDHTPKEVFMHLMDKLDSLDGNELVLTLSTLAKLLGKK